MQNRERLSEARVVIVCAGMEGALPSVIGGLVAAPVIAVPTSVGYGASFQGLAALLGMLNSCASNVTVVNIDNGFGAGYAASLMNRAVSLRCQIAISFAIWRPTPASRPDPGASSSGPARTLPRPGAYCRYPAAGSHRAGPGPRSCRSQPTPSRGPSRAGAPARAWPTPEPPWATTPRRPVESARSADFPVRRCTHRRFPSPPAAPLCSAWRVR